MLLEYKDGDNVMKKNVLIVCMLTLFIINYVMMHDTSFVRLKYRCISYYAYCRSFYMENGNYPTEIKTAALRYKKRLKYNGNLLNDDANSNEILFEYMVNEYDTIYCTIDGMIYIAKYDIGKRDFGKSPSR